MKTKFQPFLILAFCFSPSFAFEIQQIETEQNTLMAVSIDLAKDDLALYWKNPESQKPFQHFNDLKKYLSTKQQALLFATNSGIYTKENKPLGLHIENGQVLAPINRVKPNNSLGNFSLMPNGVFIIYKKQDKRSSIILDTDDYPNKLPKHAEIIYATQSGPLLLKDGNLHPRFLKDSDSLKIRNAVCTSKTGSLYFILTLKPSNFYHFSETLKSALGCQNALYLDGSLSQFYLDQKYYGASFWEIRPYVGIWAISKRISPK